MTKKDYIRIATAIKSGTPIPGAATAASVHYQVAHAMADTLEQENPHFDRSRFLAACGIQG